MFLFSLLVRNDVNLILTLNEIIGGWRWLMDFLVSKNNLWMISRSSSFGGWKTTDVCAAFLLSFEFSDDIRIVTILKNDLLSPSSKSCLSISSSNSSVLTEAAFPVLGSRATRVKNETSLFSVPFSSTESTVILTSCTLNC